MRNFYYIQTYNMMHPAIRSMLDTLGVIGIHDSLSEMKIRSKYFLGFNESTVHAHKDFSKKLSSIFPPENGIAESGVKIVSIMNPKFAVYDKLNESIAEHFGEQHVKWDDDCAGTIFFCDAPVDTSDDDGIFPDTWMMKYEIFFEDDTILLTRKNGEYAFNPSSVSFSSAVH